MALQGSDLFSEPGLSLGGGHFLMCRQRCGLPGCPFEIVFDFVAFFTAAAGDVVGVVVDVPVFEGAAVCLMVVGGEEG